MKQKYRTIYSRAKRASVKRKIHFDLSSKDFQEIVDRAQDKCEITKIPFSFEHTGKATRMPWAPSLDRIDSSSDYIKHNCRLVCVAVNLALNEWDLSVLERIARAICRHDYTEKTKSIMEISLGDITDTISEQTTISYEKIRPLMLNTADDIADIISERIISNIKKINYQADIVSERIVSDIEKNKPPISETASNGIADIASDVEMHILEQKLPPLASAKDLMKIGLYGSIKTAANDRSMGRGPEFIKIGRIVRYPRAAIISWIEKKAKRRCNELGGGKIRN